MCRTHESMEIHQLTRVRCSIQKDLVDLADLLSQLSDSFFFVITYDFESYKLTMMARCHKRMYPFSHKIHKQCGIIQ